MYVHFSCFFTLILLGFIGFLMWGSSYFMRWILLCVIYTVYEDFFCLIHNFVIVVMTQWMTVTKLWCSGAVSFSSWRFIPCKFLLVFLLISAYLSELSRNCLQFLYTCTPRMACDVLSRNIRTFHPFAFYYVACPVYCPV